MVVGPPARERPPQGKGEMPDMRPVLPRRGMTYAKRVEERIGFLGSDDFDAVVAVVVVAVVDNDEVGVIEGADDIGGRGASVGAAGVSVVMVAVVEVEVVLFDSPSYSPRDWQIRQPYAMKEYPSHFPFGPE